MKTKDLILDYSSHRNVVEQIGEHGPYILIAILFLTLIIKAIDLGDSSGLMVASSKVNTVWISHLQCHK